MKVEVKPLKTRTMVPVNINITDINHTPEVSVEPIGKLMVNKTANKKNFYHSEFYVQSPGVYQVVVKNPKSEQVFRANVDIKKQEYLSFDREFGTFSVLFIFVMLGVVLWTKKMMKNNL